jgi:hypothetical protein
MMLGMATLQRYFVGLAAAAPLAFIAGLTFESATAGHVWAQVIVSALTAAVLFRCLHPGPTTCV